MQTLSHISIPTMPHIFLFTMFSFSLLGSQVGTGEELWIIVRRTAKIRIYYSGHSTSVRYGAGRGGFSLARPRPYTGPGGYFWGNPRPAPVRGPPALIPWTGPVSYHLFLTGTRLGYKWGGGLSWDRGRECRKRHPAPGR